MGWADEVEQAVEQSMSNQDTDVETGVDSFSGISGQTGGGQGYDSTIGSSAGDSQMNAIIDAVKVGVQQAIGSSPLSQEYGALFNEKTSDFSQNPGMGTGTRFGSTWGQEFSPTESPYNDIIGSTAGLNQARIANARARVGDQLGSLNIQDAINKINPFVQIDALRNFAYPGISVANAPSSPPVNVDDFSGIQKAANATRIRDSEAAMRANIAALGPKIGALVQSLNPFKTDWAQKNLYGTQTPYKENAVNEYYVTPSGNVVPDTINNPYVSQNYSDFGMAGQDKIGGWTLSEAIQDTNNLGNTLNMLGDTGLVGQGPTPAQAETALGAPGQLGPTAVQVAMGTGIHPDIALANQVFDDDTVGYPNQMGISTSLGGTPVQEDLGTGFAPNFFDDEALWGAGAKAKPGNEFYGMVTNPTNLEIASQIDTFSEDSTGMPLDGSSPVTGLNKEDYMSFVDSLNAQPIGSSPLAPAYNEAYNYSGADFPGNAGINAVGTAFGDTWGQEFPATGPAIDSEDWVGDTDEFGLPLSKKEMDPKGKQLPWIDARTVTGDAQRDLARQWEKTVNNNMTETQLEESWQANPAIQKAIEEQEAKKPTKQEEKVAKSKYGTWNGLFNKKTAKQNLEAQKTFQKAVLSDFEKRFGSAKHWGLTRPTVNGKSISWADNKLRNQIMKTDQFLNAYDAVYGTSKGAKMVAGALSKGIGFVGGGLQGFFNKKGAGNADTLDQIIEKVESGEYEGQAELPPPNPRDKVSGGFWGLINFAKKNPDIFGSLSGDELWSLVSDEEDFWAYYEAGLAGD